jgi:precorrin-6B methylase 1
LLDDDNFAQFRKKEDKKPSKSIPLLNAIAVLESKNKVKWSDPHSNLRVTLTLKQSKNQKKIVYVYSNDPNFLKALLVRIRIAAQPGLKKHLKPKI